MPKKTPPPLQAVEPTRNPESGGAVRSARAEEAVVIGSDDRAERLARRAFLSRLASATYVAPAIVGSFAIARPAAAHSCSPHGCTPAGCQPHANQFLEAEQYLYDNPIASPRDPFTPDHKASLQLFDHADPFEHVRRWRTWEDEATSDEF